MDFKSIRIVLCLFVVMSVFSIQGNAASIYVSPPNLLPSAHPTNVPAPCLKLSELGSPRLDLQACSYVFSDNPSVGPKDETGKRVKYLDVLRTFVKRRILCFYEGYIGQGSEVGGQLDCSTGTKISAAIPPRTVCSITDDEGKDNTAFLRNHRGQDCGFPGNENYATSAPWESNQVRGLRVQALKFFRNQVVEEEIKGTFSLNIHPRCQAMADDYFQLNVNAKALSDQLVAGLSAVPPIVYTGGVNFCSKDTDLIASAQGSADVLRFIKSIPKASACFLSISRDNRIGMFLSLARCEIYTRVDDFLLGFGDKGAKKLSKITRDCVDEGNAEGQEKGREYGEEKESRSQGIDKGREVGRERFHKCYDNKVRTFFKNHGVLPPDGFDPIPGNFQLRNEVPRSKSSGMASLFNFPVIFLFGTLQNKKRRKKLLKKFAGFLALNSLILFLATTSMSSLGSTIGGWFGCGEDDSPYEETPPDLLTYVSVCTEEGEIVKPNQITPDAVLQKVIRCCVAERDVTGKIISYGQMKPEVESDPALCRECNPNCETQEENDKTGADYGGATDSAHTQSQRLASLAANPAPSGIPDHSSPTTSTLSGHTSGATADHNTILPSLSTGSSTGDSKHPASGPSDSIGSRIMSFFNRTGSSTGKSFDRDGSSNGAGKGSGSNLMDDGSFETAEVKGASYSSSGNTPGHGSGNYNGNGFSGSGADSGSGENGGDSSGAVVEPLGEMGQSGEIPASGSEDPADYFNRIGVKDSIFKIVHLRYQAKAKSWLPTTILK